MGGVKKAIQRALALIALAFTSWGAAQGIGNGTELLLTDLNSEVILGYGTVQDGQLLLNLSQAADSFYLYFIFPEGDVTTHQGRVDDGLLVVNDAGGFLDFQNVLAERGVELTVTRVEDENLNLTTPSDDSQLEQPAEGSSN